MNQIINHVEFSDIKHIGKKYDSNKVDESITQAHSDLRELLGGAFYFDVIKNLENPDYSNLINGGEFIKDEIEYIHDGLKLLVADYTHARYLYEVNNNPSPFGMVNKTSQDSQPVDRNMIRDLVGIANKDASRKWELIKEYLDINKTFFNVWNITKCSPQSNNSSFNSVRFTFLSTGK